jgi:peptidoglycan/xylan/chitin deacetylase (PgdA/CDA1 family)
MLLNKKYACITLDFEEDYGDRVNEFNIYSDSQYKIEELKYLYDKLDVPVSTFITTNILDKNDKTIELIKWLANDYHCHSHSHNTQAFDSANEITTCFSKFKEHFGFEPLGYRAPKGVLYPGDIKLITDAGFLFSSSLFPSIRIGTFNNLKSPQIPFFYDSGLLEIPLAVVNKIRLIISLSYQKLLGSSVSHILYKTFGIPDVIVYDSHLHDYIISEKSFAQLPPFMKSIYSINKYSGKEILIDFVNYLKSKGYSFITMTELMSLILDKRN